MCVRLYFLICHGQMSVRPSQSSSLLYKYAIKYATLLSSGLENQLITQEHLEVKMTTTEFSL